MHYPYEAPPSHDKPRPKKQNPPWAPVRCACPEPIIGIARHFRGNNIYKLSKLYSPRLPIVIARGVTSSEAYLSDRPDYSLTGFLARSDLHLGFG